VLLKFSSELMQRTGTNRTELKVQFSPVPVLQFWLQFGSQFSEFSKIPKPFENCSVAGAWLSLALAQLLQLGHHCPLQALDSLALTQAQRLNSQLAASSSPKRENLGVEHWLQS